ncbi:putative low-specificity L-threonine aldolase 2 [Blattella germanica]|nr:putative low-specificity L-threonine aldolase 2 [Blattella germanica]
MLIRHSRSIYQWSRTWTTLFYHSSRKISDDFATTSACYKKKMAAKNNMRIVDLRSDTVSKPTAEMRKAMFEADLGDDVYGEDPTVTKLEEKAAAMLGKESGLFVPSGTMGNLLAIMVHCSERGSEMICGEKSHTFLFEQAGPAQIAGVQIWPLQNKSDGTFDLDEMEEKIRDHSDDHEPKTSLIVVENTQNWCGGKVLPMKWIDDVSVTSSRVIFLKESRRLRKALGGGMRQVGVIAAAGIIALDSMIDRLEEDHRRAKAIAKAIADSGSKIFQVDYENLQTNILMININHGKITSTDFCDRMAEVTKEELAKIGNERIIIKICPTSKKAVRIVTYYEITDDDIAATIRKLNFVIKEYEKA